MGKLTFEGFFPNDDPMFKQGAFMSTRSDISRGEEAVSLVLDEDRSILALIEAGVRHCRDSGVSDPLSLAGLTSAYLSGMAGDALDESPITHFGKRMGEAIELLDSGIFPESLCGELERRWSR